MKEAKNNMLYLDEIREKLGIAPKKCLYEKIKGEVIIFKVQKKKLAWRNFLWTRGVNFE